MNCRHRLDEGGACASPRRWRHFAHSGFLVANDKPFHKAHDIERGVVDRNVGAQTKRWGNWHGGVLKCRNNPKLTTHVMCTCKRMAERWTTENKLRVVCIGYKKSEVGVSTCNE